MSYRCSDCRRIFNESEILRGTNPFNKAEGIDGCPRCFGINTLEAVCDETGCDSLATCGWSKPDGSRRRTCYTHWRLNR